MQPHKFKAAVRLISSLTSEFHHELRLRNSALHAINIVTTGRMTLGAQPRTSFHKIVRDIRSSRIIDVLAYTRKASSTTNPTLNTHPALDSNILEHRPRATYTQNTPAVRRKTRPQNNSTPQHAAVHWTHWKYKATGRRFRAPQAPQDRKSVV